MSSFYTEGFNNNQGHYGHGTEIAVVSVSELPSGVPADSIIARHWFGVGIVRNPDNLVPNEEIGS